MEKQSPRSKFEIWGGIECTINRVGDNYFDQLDFTGHYSRLDDIEHIASLGIEKLRYPILWERHEAYFGASSDWKWASNQLHLLKRCNVTPIVGLLHHGSGPSYTNLSDPYFPELLAAYAQKVSRQFPELEYYTPVNEPLTTARFSGLYGHWFPHAKNDLQFFRILFNQLKAVVLCMREIRKVNSAAKLIQTEDLGKTYSVPSLQYQADFENERRWLSYELLCGRVDQNHNLWHYLKYVGISDHEILFFQDNPCTPDIAGFNYYLTSERYLDDQIQNYPPIVRGGNGRDSYVDTEAIRIDHDQPWGVEVLLREAYERLKLPISLTEVFLSCTPQEQVKWLHQVHEATLRVRAEGVDVRSITFWALLGELGWNTLVTRMEHFEYEPGAFDVRNGECTPTLIADYIRSLAGRDTVKFPWLQESGWWNRTDRFYMAEPCVFE